MHPVAEWLMSCGTFLMAFFSGLTIYYFFIGDPRRKGIPRFLVLGHIEGDKAVAEVKCLGGTPIELLGAHVVVETRCGLYEALDHSSQNPRLLCPKNTFPPDFERFEITLDSDPSPDLPLFLQLELGYSDAPYGYVICRYPFRFQGGRWVLAADPFKRYCFVDKAFDLKFLEYLHRAWCWLRKLWRFARKGAPN